MLHHHIETHYTIISVGGISHTQTMSKLMCFYMVGAQGIEP